MSAKTATEYSYSIVRSRVEPGEPDHTPAMQTFATQVQEVLDERTARGWLLVNASNLLWAPPRGEHHGFIQQHFVFSREFVGERRDVDPRDTTVSFTARRRGSPVLPAPPRLVEERGRLPVDRRFANDDPDDPRDDSDR